MVAESAKRTLSGDGGWHTGGASRVYFVGNFWRDFHARAALAGVGTLGDDCLWDYRGDDRARLPADPGGKLVRGARGSRAVSRAVSAALPRCGGLSKHSSAA